MRHHGNCSTEGARSQLLQVQGSRVAIGTSGAASYSVSNAGNGWCPRSRTVTVLSTSRSAVRFRPGEQDWTESDSRYGGASHTLKGSTWRSGTFQSVKLSSLSRQAVQRRASSHGSLSAESHFLRSRIPTVSPFSSDRRHWDCNRNWRSNSSESRSWLMPPDPVRAGWPRPRTHLPLP